jgi:hypothetical protein
MRLAEINNKTVAPTLDIPPKAVYNIDTTKALSRKIGLFRENGGLTMKFSEFTAINPIELLSKKLKKFTAAVLATTLILATGGCSVQGDLSDETAAETALTQTAAETTAATEYKTIAPPEDGWTLELLNEVTYINGKDVDIPFSYSVFGEDYTIPDLIVSEEVKRIGGRVYYDNKPFFSIAGNYSGTTPSLTECTIDTFLLIDEFNQSEMSSSNIIVINGITIGSSRDEVMAKMGTYNTENYREFETGFSYDIIGTDGYINIGGFDANDKINSISINYVR